MWNFHFFPIFYYSTVHFQANIIFLFQDYHAILIYAPDERAVVYDLDSELPFPTFFWKYATETFRRDEALPPEWHRMFRLVSASDYLKHFASDRHHMKRKDGSWIKTPPDYSPISTPCKL